MATRARWVPLFVCLALFVAMAQSYNFATKMEEAKNKLYNLQGQLQQNTETGDGVARAVNSNSKPSRIRAWSKPQPDDLKGTSVMKLKTPQHKMSAIRKKMLQSLVQKSREAASNNESVITIALLAFGVLLFDLIGDAMFGTSTDIWGSLNEPNMISGRETMLPSFGILGDNFNNMAEIALNMLTIYMYRDESPDCGERLLCESNQQAVSRGLFDSFLTYLSGFAISFLLNEAPVSQNLEAMRAGRTGKNCGELFPRCAISL